MALIYVFYVALQISLFTLSPRMFSCKLILVFFGGCNSNKFVTYSCELSSKLSYNYGSYKVDKENKAVQVIGLAIRSFYN